MYDVIIIGMGPAGISAGIYAKRSGMNVLMLEKEAPGGLMNKTNIVDNYPGFKNITGPELALKMFNHIKEQEVPYKIEEVIDIDIQKNKKIVKTNKNTYETKAVILTAGRQPRKPKLKGITELEGKGVSYCSVCDAPLFKGKDVAIIGSGNSAFEEGIYISSFVKNLYILSSKDEIKADKILQKKVKKIKNIKIMKNSIVLSLESNEGVLSGVILENGKKIEVQGLFVYIGYSPTTAYLEALNILDSKGYIEVNENMETKVKGFYAAGDVIKKDLYQIVTAVSEGAIAAVNAKKYISK